MKNKNKIRAEKAWVTIRKITVFIESLSPKKRAIAKALRSGLTEEKAKEQFRPAYVTMVLESAEKKGIVLTKQANIKVEAKKVSHKDNDYNVEKARPNKTKFKNFWVQVIAKSKAKEGIVSALSNMFATELEICKIATLNKLYFLTYEYRNSGLSGFIRKQRIFLGKNPKLKNRIIDIVPVKFSTMVFTSVENQFAHVDADYCAEWGTIKTEVEMMLRNKVVVIGGTICLTVKRTSRKVAGLNATEQVLKLLKTLPDFELVPFEENKYYEYKDGTHGQGMVGFIIKRIA